jgi:ferredoxin
MALKINGQCVNCYACVDVCPTSSIFKAKKHFAIDPRTCTECAGEFDAPQCASICPIECAIVDHDGIPLNPVGSLTGIPPDKMSAAMEEIRAR